MLNSSEHVNLLMSLMWDSNFFNLLFLNNPSLLQDFYQSGFVSVAESGSSSQIPEN